MVNSQEACARLVELGIAKHASITFDKAENGVSVILDVKEVGRLFANTGTEFGNNEGSAVK